MTTSKKTPCPKHQAHNGRYVHLCRECVALNPPKATDIVHSTYNGSVALCGASLAGLPDYHPAAPPCPACKAEHRGVDGLTVAERAGAQ